MAALGQRRRHREAGWPGPPPHSAAWSFTRRGRGFGHGGAGPGARGHRLQEGSGIGRWHQRRQSAGQPPRAPRCTLGAYSPNPAPGEQISPRGRGSADGRPDDEVAGEPPHPKIVESGRQEVGGARSGFQGGGSGRRRHGGHRHRGRMGVREKSVPCGRMPRHRRPDGLLATRGGGKGSGELEVARPSRPRGATREGLSCGRRFTNS